MNHLEFVQEWNTKGVKAKAGVGYLWADNHANAWAGTPFIRIVSPFEMPLKAFLRALADYADAHQARYESPIGEDYVLGEHWKQAARAFLGLLNGESGRFDCGTLDGCVRELARRAGFSPEEADQL